MPTMWRVENEKGQGCYSGYNEDNVCPIYVENSPLEKHSQNNGHPSPYGDKGIERAIKTFEICGFKDLTQAKNWFSDEELAFLDSYGFKLKQVEVEQITAIGEKQILAVRDIHNIDELEYILP